MKKFLLYAVLTVAAAALLLPFYWMVSSSLKTNNEVFTIPVTWFPDTAMWSNYTDIFTKSSMATWLKNTLVLSVTVTVLQVLTGSFAAYGFSKVASRDATCCSWPTSRRSRCRGSPT